jgi:hypothetical protein
VRFEQSSKLYALTRASWQSHFGQLTDMRLRINRVGEALKTLEQTRPDPSAQEQEAIDRIRAVARELASDTGAAIEYLNENQNHLQSWNTRTTKVL